MLDKSDLDAIRQIMRDEFRRVVREELEPVRAEIGVVKANQEYGLKWPDRIEQRANPVAEYVETMFLHTDK